MSPEANLAKAAVTIGVLQLCRVERVVVAWDEAHEARKQEAGVAGG